MEKSLKEYVSQKLSDLINAPSCCAEAKAQAQKWLDCADTEKEAEESKKLIAELEEDIMPVDGLIAFAKSDMGAQIFGEEGAKGIAAHGEEIKAQGAKYCDCPACKACEEILSKKAEILG